MNPRYLERSEVPAAILRASGYNGRKFRLLIGESVTLTDGFWSGGSRTTWRAVELDTGRAVEPTPALKNPPAFGGLPQAPTVEIPPNVAIFGHSIFCGEDAGLVIHIRPENAAALLPAPTGCDLSADAKIVLCAVCCFISKARRDAAAHHGLDAARYDAALRELIAAGLVTPRNAATIAGKNTFASFPPNLRRI
jgi:hypothetical protein